MLNNYRHGDIALIGIKTIDKDLKESKDNVLIQNGSGGNAHSFRNGKFYSTKINEFVIGYFEALDDCVLLHKEHGQKIKGKSLREAKIKKGIYEVRVQHEDTHDGMKQIKD